MNEARAHREEDRARCGELDERMKSLSAQVNEFETAIAAANGETP